MTTTTTANTKGTLKAINGALQASINGSASTIQHGFNATEHTMAGFEDGAAMFRMSMASTKEIHKIDCKRDIAQAHVDAVKANSELAALLADHKIKESDIDFSVLDF